MRNGSSLVLGILLCITSLIGFIPFAEAQIEPEVSVAVSVAPLGGIVDVIGREFVDVSILLPEGVEPHAAQLPQSSVDAASSADLLVLTGHYPWEESLAEQVDTPYISLEDFEAFGAELLLMPGVHDDGALLSQDHNHGDENIHSYWLLPKNAIAIANATLDRLKSLAPSRSDYWNSAFLTFIENVEEFQNLVGELNQEYGFSNLRAVVVFPAEAYVAETFGIEVVTSLSQGENVFISGADLLVVQTGLANGSLDIILGSDIARLQPSGEFAVQLAEDTASEIIWWRVIFFSGLSDYLSIMTYNLGILTSSMEDSGPSASNLSINFLAIGIAGFLAIVVMVETALLFQHAKKEE
ncbi:MAG: metal ABC transporter solute-binding protein, Zn/Mn family [Candidatus Thorarchaeota archaeon]